MQTHIKTFPLNKLVFSALNVRDGTPDEENISGLAASIKAHGLIENLVVTPEQKKMGVVAGRRRLAALQLLLKNKDIKADFPVECRVIDKDRAVEMSVAENSNREELSVVEEFLAFHKMAEAGNSVDDIAASFGVTPLVVQRRLKLAAVAPQFIEMLRTGAIKSIDVLMALSLTDDHEKQLEVWRSLKPYDRNANIIRARLTPESLDYPRDRLATFVGLKAYQKAGGAILRDLFSDDQKEAKFLDVALVHRLAQEKLDTLAEEVKAEGFAWVEGRLDFDYSDRHKYGTTVMMRTEPTAEQSERLNQIAERVKEIEAKVEALSNDDEANGDAMDALYDEQERLDEEERDIKDALQMPDPAFTHLVGAVVTLNHAGRVEVLKGLIRPEDKKKVREAEEQQRRETGRTAIEGGGSDPNDERSPYSERVTRALSAHLTMALRAKVAVTPNVAMAMFVQQALPSVLGFVPVCSMMPVEIKVENRSVRDHSPDIESCAATKEVSALVEQWRARLPTSGLLTWLLELPTEELSSLFAVCVAQGVNAIEHRSEPHEGTREVMRAVALDMADWWRPTAENYFSGIRKEQVLAAVAEATTAETAEGLKKCKKDELIDKARAAIEGTRWLPSAFRV